MKFVVADEGSSKRRLPFPALVEIVSIIYDGNGHVLAAWKGLVGSEKYSDLSSGERKAMELRRGFGAALFDCGVAVG